MIEKNKDRKFVRFLAGFGCISNGLVYTSIGVIAILSFLRLKDGGADESSMLAFLGHYLVGRVFVWVVLLGLVCYVCWRIYETVNDPYDYGKMAKGLAKRTGIAFSSIGDALIAYSALQVLVHTDGAVQNGRPEEERRLVSQALQESYGAALVISVGIIICLTAVVQFVYVLSSTYLERLDIDAKPPVIKKSIHVLAWCGYIARGIILAIIGFFCGKAGMLKSAEYVVNTDKAFDYLGDEIGHFSFIVVAAGTIAYGLFMFVLGWYYDTDKD